MSMTALTLRALGALPTPLAELIRAHRYADDIDDLVGEVWVCLAEARGDTTLEQIFSQARARVRRYTQDVAHYSVGLDDARAGDLSADEEPTALRRADYVREIARDLRVTQRRAQQIVKAQLARAAACGDLFAGAA